MSNQNLSRAREIKSGRISNPHDGPKCMFCNETAAYVAASSRDQGLNYDWRFVCRLHAHGWNDGGDWDAPAWEIHGKVAL